MKIQHQAEMIRGQVMAMSDHLVAPPELDEADRTMLLRLVFELDRLGDRIETLAGDKGGGA